jgi:two-component system, OmpR family, response regulator VicR
MIIQIILKGQGYDTILATSIAEAKLKIRIHKPALILMDVFLSDDDGCAFCKQLKEDEETSHTRIIMMSGNDSFASQMSSYHADDFMVKPFDYSDLLDRVQKQMQEARVLVNV